MELIEKYFPELSEMQIAQLQQYETLLWEWNQKINLVSRKDEDKIREHHILHALSIAQLIDFLPEASVLDLGTGGGLPGIPLAILFPETHFHLVDSIAKKIKVVKAITDEMNLQNVSAEQTRVEEHKGKYDFVVTRAVAKTAQLLRWTKHLYKKESQHELRNGLIALKGGDLTEELSEVKKDYDLIPLSSFYDEDYFTTKEILYVPLG